MKEKNANNWFEIILKTKKKVEKEAKDFDEERLVEDLMTRIFVNLQSKMELPIILSFKEQEKLEYVKKLEWLFQSIGLFSEYFCKTPVDETYDKFDYYLHALVRKGYAKLDLTTYSYVTLHMNPFIIEKILNEQDGYEDFINLGADILRENKLYETIKEKQLLEKRKNRKEGI